MKKVCVLFFDLFTLRGCYPIQHKVFSKKIKLSIIFIFVLYPLNVHCENFKVGSDTWSPFFMVSNNQFTGIGFDIITEVVRRTGDTITIKHLPNKRALLMFDKKEIDMMVIDSPLWNDPKKAKSMIFSNEIMSVQEYIYFLKEKYIEVEKPTDLSGKTMYMLRGYYYPVFEDVFKNGIVKKYEVDSESHLLKLLVHKRADAIFMDSIAFRYNISKSGYDKTLFRKGFQLSETTLGIKIRREKASILPRFNRAIAEMKRDGAIELIINKYTK
jgi:polar amino acid transport system substrate-binding protein